MNKISVVATVRAAYGFTFRNLGAIIGAIWLPMVLVTVAGFFAIQGFFGAMLDSLTGGNPGALGPAMLMMLAYLVASLLLYAVMYVAVTQLALGAPPPSALLHFVFGPLERRVFRSLIAMMGVFFLLIFVAMLAALAVTLAISAAGIHSTAIQSAALLSAAIYLTLAIVVPRFFLPLPAIAVGEDGPVLRRAWELSAGNFLQLLVVAIAVFGPSLAIMQAADLLLPGGNMVATGGEQAQAIALLRREQAIMPVVSGIAFFVSPLTLGLVVGASVSVWRALTATAPAELKTP
jgi:hypothetical protein